ncbi:hypothetical protein niasHT_013994 [Heterodera trifolii]|uniref:CCHC-type domain-containing protein n=1 Tax=Heterodera trifolii TaxID=157864 RepID=A0ABD2KM74_9BILA
MSTSGGSSNEFPFGTSQAFGQETKMFLSGKDDEFPISAIDRKLWQGKTTVKISDLEKAQNDVAKLEDGVNRAVRHMNRSLNQKVNWVNDVVANTNANFDTLKVQFVTLTERVDILEQDNDGTNSGGTVSITNQNRASLAPFATPMGNAQPNQVVPNQVPIHQLSSEDEDDGPTLFGLNMLSSGSTVGSGLEMFCEESVFAFDDWAERFKDYLSVSGKAYTEQEKVTRLKLALRDTPRALFKELLPAQTDTLDSALSELRQKLDSPQRREIAKRTLSLCKQREDETVAQFLRRLTPLVDATNSSLTGDIRKEKICEEFLDRLKPNISFLIRLVGLSRAKDLDLVRAQAEELEALLLMNKGDEASRLSQAVNALNNQSSQSQWSTEANQNNDRAGQWSSDNNVRGFRPFSGSNATRQQRRGRGGRGRSRNWGGGRQEQFSQRNWSSNPRCHYCDRAGHFAYNCHQRRANFRGNSNQSFHQGRWSNQQPRQSQGQWQNRQNPVNMMDATSSSNTSPGFFENLAKSLLDLKIQDNRNYKNEEPRSGAMNALTHIKPETTAMDCQVETELLKESTSESPACGPETKTNAPKTSNWERPSVRSKVASLMFITLMLFGMTLPFTTANMPHLPMHPLVCQTQNGGKIWQLPAVTGCSKLSIDHSKAPVGRTFDVFSPNLFEHSAEAWACRKVRKSVRKYTSITNVPIQETLEPLMLQMTPSECKQMSENGKCSLGLLINDSGLLHTDKKLDLSPRMWLIGSFSWSTISTENCYLFKTKIMSQHGSTVMQSPLGSVNNCQFKAGQCEMEDKTLLMWDTNTTRACEFSKIGTWKGLQLDNIWISDEVSFRLTFSNNTKKVNSCGLNLIKSEEGFAVQDLPSDDSNESSKRSRRTRSLESWVTESEMNSKLSYLDEQVREMLTLSFSQTIKSICEYMLETRRWAATALLSDPTTFARKLFQSGKLVAKVAGPELIKVWPCIELQAHDYEFAKIGSAIDSEFECFDKIPIKFRVKDNKRMAFIDPRTMILSSDARLAPCSEYRKQLIFVRGSLYEVDQIDAQVKPVNANRIDGFSLNLSLAPTYARHSFLHLALVNVSDFIGQFYDANLARESELTFQIKGEDTVITKTLSEQWEQVSESIRNKMFGNWEQIGKIVMSVMIIIVFADFLIRFGLMIRDEYVGRGATRRMTFGGNITQEIVKSPACLNMTDLNACVELGNEIELSPVKLIEPAQIQACKIAGKRRRPAKKTRFSFRTPKILIGLLIIFLPNAFANPDMKRESESQNKKKWQNVRGRE